MENESTMDPISYSLAGFMISEVNFSANFYVRLTNYLFIILCETIVDNMNSLALKYKTGLPSSKVFFLFENTDRYTAKNSNILDTAWMCSYKELTTPPPPIPK